MIGIVLAAGYATRMGELTKNFPKPLLKVEGRTKVAQFARQNFSLFVMN